MAKVDRAAIFVARYVAEARASLELLKGAPLNEAEEARLAEAASRFTDKPAALYNNYNGAEIQLSLAEAFVHSSTRAPGGTVSQAIWTGHGTCFKPQTEFHSVMGDMLQMLGDQRGVAKKKMFALIASGLSKQDPSVKAMDQEQKIWKLLANSYFGATGEKRFHFYNDAMGPAVTYNGRLITTTTLWTFEAFLRNNFWIEDEDELATHLAACLRSVPGSPVEEWGDPAGWRPTREYVAARLRDACAPTWNSAAACEAAADAALRAAGEDGLWALALRGDPYRFLSFPAAEAALEVALAEPFRDPAPKELAKERPAAKEALDRLWTGLARWCAPRWFPGDLPRRAGRMKRRAVILADTDSTFLALEPWMNRVGQIFDPAEMTPDELLTVTNCMIYQLGKLNAEMMAELTKNLGVPEDKRPILEFKNEYVFRRMVLTGGKKHYVGLMTHQEGKTISEGPDQLEIKGLAIKKTVVAKKTQKFFERAIEVRLLRADDPDRSGLIHDTVEIERRVRASIAAGEMTYSTPAVLGRLGSYVNPYAMPVVRGMLAWNAAHPETPIQEGDRVNSFKVSVGSDAGRLAAEMAAFPEGSEERRRMECVMARFFGPDAPEELARNGLNWLAIPKGERSVPTWARPLLDAEQAVQANVAPILPILEAVGVRPLRNSASETYSSTIDF